MAVNEVILNGETLVSLANDTVTADSLLNGATAHNAEGEPIEGSVVVPTKTSQLTNDSGFVAIAAKTTDEWADETEIPAKGTICAETTAEGEIKLKIGDGVSAFSGLKYVDCGNADTLEGLHANEIASNPNLLINPDFAINQRQKSGTITEAGYFIDCWKLESGSVTINDDHTLTLNGTISQILETDPGAGTAVSCSSSSASCSYDITAKTFSISTTTPTPISWAKLEVGSVATPFVSPDMATELLKCQRYYATIGQIIFSAKTNMIPYQNYYSLPVTMRVNPTIIVSDADNDMGFASLRNNSSIKISINTACNDNRYINIWAPNNDMVINSEYRIIITASAEL